MPIVRIATLLAWEVSGHVRVSHQGLYGTRIDVSPPSLKPA